MVGLGFDSAIAAIVASPRIVSGTIGFSYCLGRLLQVAIVEKINLVTIQGVPKSRGY